MLFEAWCERQAKVQTKCLKFQPMEAMTGRDYHPVVSYDEIRIEHLFELHEPALPEISKHPDPAARRQITNLGAAVVTILAIGHEYFDGAI